MLLLTALFLPSPLPNTCGNGCYSAEPLSHRSLTRRSAKIRKVCPSVAESRSQYCCPSRFREVSSESVVSSRFTPVIALQHEYGSKCHRIAAVFFSVRCGSCRRIGLSPSIVPMSAPFSSISRDPVPTRPNRFAAAPTNQDEV